MKLNINTITSSIAALSLLLVGVLSAPSPAKAEGRSTLEQALGLRYAKALSSLGGVTMTMDATGQVALKNTNGYDVDVLYAVTYNNVSTGLPISIQHYNTWLRPGEVRYVTGDGVKMLRVSVHR